MKRLVPTLLLLAIGGTLGVFFLHLPKNSPESIEALPSNTAEVENWTVSVNPIDAAGAHRDSLPFLKKFCLDCHSSDTRSGGVDLESVIRDGKSSELWTRAAGEIRLRTMPPRGQLSPDKPERDRAIRLFEALAAVDSPDSERSRHSLRRLNRSEYDNTIRDLTGLDLHPAADFPADDIGYDFDNVADVLSLSPLLIERYCSATEKVVAEIFRSESAKAKIFSPRPERPDFAAKRQFIAPERERAVKRLVLSARDVPKADPKDLELQRAYDILRAFGDRAYRRPILHEELTRLLTFVESAQRNREDFETGIRRALTAMLVSPNFLFHFAEEETIDSQTRLTDFALVSRLSYFLWSSMPDDELLDWAAKGTIRIGNTLARQVDRMLRDERASSLASNFGSQWLRIRSVKNATPDTATYPEFDEELRTAMLRESELFFASIVSEDRSILELLDADYTFVNERLARHYQIDGIVGSEFRRVPLTGKQRGGILTQASVLTATSPPGRSSPVQRGRWILDVVLGISPGSPPPGADNLKVSLPAKEPLSFRHRLEAHRSNPQCASCHRRMDPLGFGLENFDAIGAWRVRDASGEIDASGIFPGGERFCGIAELKEILKTHSDTFMSSFTEKLAVYALGRGLNAADRPIVDAIARQVAEKDFRFSALVQCLVHSELFQSANVNGRKP